MITKLEDVGVQPAAEVAEGLTLMSVDPLILKVAPERASMQYAGSTGIYVRAMLGVGTWGTYDIAQLDKASLLAFLRQRGGDNPWAEDTVGILLGHGHLHEGKPT